MKLVHTRPGVELQQIVRNFNSSGISWRIYKQPHSDTSQLVANDSITTTMHLLRLANFPRPYGSVADGYGIRVSIRRSRIQFLAIPHFECNPVQVTCTHVALLPSYWALLFGTRVSWEVNKHTVGCNGPAAGVRRSNRRSALQCRERQLIKWTETQTILN